MPVTAEPSMPPSSSATPASPGGRGGPRDGTREGAQGDQAPPAVVRIPLTQLKRGDRAVVDLNDLPPDESKLLSAMGLEDQCEVRVCRAGTPCIVQIEATRLGISADVAAKILATPCSCYPDAGPPASAGGPPSKSPRR